jgi:hypothetical protein
MYLLPVAPTNAINPHLFAAQFSTVVTCYLALEVLQQSFSTEFPTFKLLPPFLSHILLSRLSKTYVDKRSRVRSHYGC